MVSLSTWEIWRPAEKRPWHITFRANHPLRASCPSPPHFHIFFFFLLLASPRSLLDGPDRSQCYFFLSTFHIVRWTSESCSSPCSQYEIRLFRTLRWRVCLQNWIDSSLLCSSSHRILWISLRGNFLPSLESRGATTAPPPPTSRYGVSRSQSALCCSVLFTLFVVLNLIVINIFDLLCIWQPYLWEMLSMVGASFWNVLIIRIPLFWDFPPSFKNSISKKRKKNKQQKYSFIVLVLH